jgi:putative spermidine/putrescine transport system ATP-binding protein
VIAALLQHHVEVADEMAAEVQLKRGALPISITGVTKSYGALKALHDVSLDIEAAEFLTLLGPSGSGKTTLLMVIAGFVRADCGSIRFGGAEIITTPPHKRNVGMVFQNYALFPHMSVRDNIAYPLRIRRLPKPERNRRVDELLGMVQLADHGERRIDQLSGGQRQRIALARAIACGPGVLLMDEPLSALDKNLREHMQLELRRLHERLGTTTVYVTHDQREALTLSNRIAVMRDGRIVQTARPMTLYERPNSKFIAGFIGQSNFLPVQVRGEEVRLFGQVIKVSNVAGKVGSPSWLVLRPEKIEIVRGNCPERDNCFDGLVRDAIYQGDLVLVSVTLPNGKEVAIHFSANRQAIERLPKPGESVTLHFHPEEAVVVSE